MWTQKCCVFTELTVCAFAVDKTQTIFHFPKAVLLQNTLHHNSSIPLRLIVHGRVVDNKSANV